MKIIIDTNLFFSAYAFDKTILKLIDSCFEKFQIFTSLEIIAEIKEILLRDTTRNKIKNYLEEEVFNFIEKIVDESNIEIPSSKLTTCRDPKDNKFLELALEVNADYIISGDKDLLELKEYQGTKIIKPSEFIEELQLEL